MKSKRYLFTLAVIFLCGQAQAQQFIVDVPDSLMFDGEKWEHFTQAEHAEKAQLFLDKCVFASHNMWVIDLAVAIGMKGRVKNFAESGITVKPYSQENK